MGYKRINWKDRVLITDDAGNIVQIIQEGTPLSAFNLNHMEDELVRGNYDKELIKKNQLELLISRDLDNLRVSMDEGYWFDSLKNTNKTQNLTDCSIENNKITLNSSKLFGTAEFKPHEIEFKTDKVTYYHKRKATYSNLTASENSLIGSNKITVNSETIKFNY